MKERFIEKLKKYKNYMAVVFMSILILITCSKCESDLKTKVNNRRPDKFDDIDKVGLIPNHKKILEDWIAKISIPELSDEYLKSVDTSKNDNNNKDDKEQDSIVTKRPTPTTTPRVVPSTSSPTTVDPTVAPSTPTPVPTKKPDNNTYTPTKTPTPEPTVNPTPDPTVNPTPEPTPTKTPVPVPTKTPTPTPTKTPTPTPTKTPTPTPNDKNHQSGNHKYGSWYSINDSYERRDCSCGASETRAHKYSNSTKTVSNKNGKHTVTTTKTCVNCKHKVEAKNTSSCSYTITNYDDSYEYKKCSECGYTTTSKHNIKTIENADKSVTYKCTNPGCGYSKTIAHTHTYNINNWDDSYEYHVCSGCGDTLSVSHNLGGKVVNSDGSISYPCTNSGCGYSRLHIHTIAESVVPVKSESVCYDVVGTCSVCGDELYRSSIGHNYQLVEEGKKQNLMRCTVCGYQIIVNKTATAEANLTAYMLEPEHEEAYSLVRDKK